MTIPEDDDFDPESMFMAEMGEVPSHFHQFIEKEPFNQCIQCECQLYSGDSTYVIQKSYVKNEVVFEFAICETCHNQLGQEVSKESMEAIRQFIFQNVHFGRHQKLLEKETRDVKDWLDECIVCRKSKDTFQRFTDIAFCMGPNILYGELPMSICESCENTYHNLLSKKTKEKLGEFIGNHFDCTPESEVPQPDRTPVLI